MLTHKQLEALIELISDDTESVEITNGETKLIFWRGGTFEVRIAYPPTEVCQFRTLSEFINYVREGDNFIKVDYFIYDHEEDFHPTHEPFVTYPEHRDQLPEITFDTCNLVAFKNKYDIGCYRRIRYTYKGKVREYHAQPGEPTFDRVEEKK